jgi:hypothetical protein
MEKVTPLIVSHQLHCVYAFTQTNYEQRHRIGKMREEKEKEKRKEGER